MVTTSFSYSNMLVELETVQEETAQMKDFWKERWNCFVLPFFFWSLSFPPLDKIGVLHISDNGLPRTHAPLQPHDAEHMLRGVQGITKGSRKCCSAQLIKMLHLHLLEG